MCAPSLITCIITTVTGESSVVTEDGTDRDVKRLTVAMNVISKKWHPVIVQRLFADGSLRFSELQDRLDGISSKVLTESLEDLVENELLHRTVVSESPKRVEYTLTDDGRDLQSILSSLASWGERYLDPDPTVLIIDDDPRLVNMYAGWLADDYEVKRAYHGESGLSVLSEDVDIVLLDRRMPGMPGEAVLEQIRDWGFDTRVIMLTAIPVDLDILGMSFDAYLTKPGTKEQLTQLITDVLTRDSYDDRTQEYVVLNAKRALLENELAAEELAADDRYEQLLDRLATLETEIDDPTEGFDETDRLVTILGTDDDR